MNGFGKEKGFKGMLKKIFLTVIIVSVLGAGGYFAFKLFFVPAPVIEGLDAFKAISSEKKIVINAKNAKSLVITIKQNGKETELLRDAVQGNEKSYTIQVKPKELQLKEGPATVSVIATAGFKETPYQIESIIDTVPPSLEAGMSPYFVPVGGGGFIAVKSQDADSVFLKLNDYRFRGFKAGGASDYYIFFPVPIDVKEGSTLYAVAEDSAGNQRIRPVDTKIRGKEYRSSTLNITDAFINTAVVSLLNKTETSDPVGSFKEVNEKMRGEGIAKLREISKITEPKMLWEGNFLQMKNSQVMAMYGDKRDYVYNGRKISESVHLGYDLAATANAPVEAANSGVVRFTGDIGIYGNTIVIDHGMGLMSLYSHLSAISVKEGEEVSKGAVIGRSGSTGFAGGDHLHFGILIQGYEVSPVFWWDSHWIQVNIYDYLSKGNTAQ
ncbi:MAG: M23 family metallopeptidase [Nitrospirae bacterium]|nr:M23 family metallopeptidase [Nitrospirota bacterium]